MWNNPNFRDNDDDAMKAEFNAQESVASSEIDWTKLTTAEFEEFCESIKKQRDVVDEISKQKKDEEQKLAQLEDQMIAALAALGRDNYQSKVGTFYLSHRTSVKVPKTPEAREAFFTYLKDKGVFENLITVNSQTLNSFYKEEFAAAQAEGRGLEFEIPGLDEPTIKESLGFRKAK